MTSDKQLTSDLQRLPLEPLFEPAGVVVAGASSHPGKFGFAVLHNIITCGYQGRIFATNRNGGTLLGIDCLTSVADVPAGQAELVYVCVPASAAAMVSSTMAALPRKKGAPPAGRYLASAQVRAMQAKER